MGSICEQTDDIASGDDLTNVPNAPAAPTPSNRLTSVGFIALLATQFLGATNDNIFRWFVVGVGKQYFSKNPATVLMAGTACFVVPYLLLASIAGYLADRLSKRTVIVACKVAELIIMLLGVLAVFTEQIWAIFAVLTMMGAQSALFSPSKTGSIPELLDETRMSAANGWFGLATVMATVVGTAIGNLLSDFTEPRGTENIGLSVAVLLGMASIGLLTSLLIKAVPAADPKRTFPWNTFKRTWQDLGSLWSLRDLWRVTLGITFFWSLGTLANLNIDQFAFARGASQQSHVTPLLVALIFGIGGGSVLAGVLSRGKIELGLLQVGAAGIAFSLVGLFIVWGPLVSTDVTGTTIASGTSYYLHGIADYLREFKLGYWVACFFLLTTGISAGLFNVPLESYLQHRSPREKRGSILAAANLVTFVGILFASLLFWVMRMPVESGSLLNVTAMNSLQVDPHDRTKIHRLTTDFKDGFEPTMESPLPDEYLGSVNGAARALLAGNMAWAEMEVRQRTPASRAAVIRRYPEYKELVTVVVDESMGRSLFQPRDIFLVSGLLTVGVLGYIFWRLPHECLRFLFRILMNSIYRLRIYGQENLPKHGPALLISNHVSWLDGQMLMYASDRPLRMFVWAANFRNPIGRYMAKTFDMIEVSAGPKSIVRAIQAANRGLRNGDLIGIFPEGGISRTGQLNSFRPGMFKILKNTDAPIIPVYIDGMWGSILSFERGRFFTKWPKRLPYPVSIHIGKPIHNAENTHQARQAITELGARAVQQRQQGFICLPSEMIRKCKQSKFRSKVADSSGVDLTGGMALLRTLVLRRLLKRHVLGDDETHVGVFLPPSVGGCLTNLALGLDKRIAVNLNYTVSSDVLNGCIASAGIQHVLTSRQFMSKMDFDLDTELVYLEDLKDKPTLGDKIACALAAFAMPASMLERSLRVHDVKGDDVMTVIFTSGSTGKPKGVMLTYDNIASNAEAIDQVIHLTPADVIVGILPFFHSMGFTVTLWTPMVTDIKAVFHYSPIDAKRIGKLIEDHQATILLSTPTFLRNYLRRCTKEQLASLNLVVAGAEKLPGALSDLFEQKFGIRPVEGYGCTELSPLVSVNVPASRNQNTDQLALKEGSVGRPIAGVAAKITHLETGEVLGLNQEGMLHIKGPNVMKGYLDEVEKTAKVLQDGWYNTGDVAYLDEDGFIHITGRKSRFSKIGGEMVPHILVEDTLAELIGLDDEGTVKVAVSAVPDEKKGERLIVLHTKTDKTVEQLREGLTSAGLPNIFVPSADSFMEVDAIPILGTGKVDLKGVKEKALELFDTAS